MKLRFEIDQSDSFRRGIDRPKSIVSIDVNPADLPQESRDLIANHLRGIDVLQSFYCNGDIILGYEIPELAHSGREPKRIIATGATIDALLVAIRENDATISQFQKYFDRSIQFRLISKPPKNEADFFPVSDHREAQIEQVLAHLRLGRRVCFDAFIHDVQHRLNKELNARSYTVFLLPIPQSTAQARFYCERVFSATFMNHQVVAHSPVIVFNEKTGRTVEANNLYHALEIYLFGNQAALVDELSILRWNDDDEHWVIFPPEEIGGMAEGGGKPPLPKE